MFWIRFFKSHRYLYKGKVFQQTWHGSVDWGDAIDEGIVSTFEIRTEVLKAFRNWRFIGKSIHSQRLGSLEFTHLFYDVSQREFSV